MVEMVVANAEPIGSPILGIVIPGFIFVLSFALTYLLYRHFTKGSESGKKV